MLRGAYATSSSPRSQEELPGPTHLRPQGSVLRLAPKAQPGLVHTLRSFACTKGDRACREGGGALVEVHWTGLSLRLQSPLHIAASNCPHSRADAARVRSSEPKFLPCLFMDQFLDLWETALPFRPGQAGSLHTGGPSPATPSAPDVERRALVASLSWHTLGDGLDFEGFLLLGMDVGQADATG